MKRLLLINIFLFVFLGCSSEERTFKEGKTFKREELRNVILFSAEDPTRNTKTYNGYDDIYIVSLEDKKIKRVTFDKKSEIYPVWIDKERIGFFKSIGRPLVGGEDFFIKNLVTGKERKAITGFTRKKESSHLERLFSISETIFIGSALRNYFFHIDSFPEENYGMVIDELLENKTLREIPFIGYLYSVSFAKRLGVAVERDTSHYKDLLRGNYSGKRKTLVEEKSQEIAIFSLDSPEYKFLTNDTFPDYMPSISPDGRYIAYTSERAPIITKYDTLRIPNRKEIILERTHGNFDIFVIDLKTGRIRRLTESISIDDNPIWSPNGEKIAFLSDRTGSKQIWIMNRDGSNKEQLTSLDVKCGEYTRRYQYLSWSPD